MEGPKTVLDQKPHPSRRYLTSPEAQKECNKEGDHGSSCKADDRGYGSGAAADLSAGDVVEAAALLCRSCLRSSSWCNVCPQASQRVGRGKSLYSYCEKGALFGGTSPQDSGVTTSRRCSRCSRRVGISGCIVRRRTKFVDIYGGGHLPAVGGFDIADGSFGVRRCFRRLPGEFFFFKRQHQRGVQQELAGRTSQFFLQVQQQIFKKIYRAKMCPKTEEELVKCQVSISSYFKEVRRLQGPARNGPNDVDACLCNGFSISRRFLCCKEIPGVGGCSSMEQSVLDGHWQIAYSSVVDREVAERNSLGTSVLAVGASQLGCSELFVSERDRPPFDKEGGNCFPEKKASFSKASKVRERTKGFVMQKENGGMARVDAVPVLHDGLFSNENRVPIN